MQSDGAKAPGTRERCAVRDRAAPELQKAEDKTPSRAGHGQMAVIVLLRDRNAPFHKQKERAHVGRRHGSVRRLSARRDLNLFIITLTPQ